MQEKLSELTASVATAEHVSVLEQTLAQLEQKADDLASKAEALAADKAQVADLEGAQAAIQQLEGRLADAQTAIEANRETQRTLNEAMADDVRKAQASVAELESATQAQLDTSKADGEGVSRELEQRAAALETQLKSLRDAAAGKEEFNALREHVQSLVVQVWPDLVPALAKFWMARRCIAHIVQHAIVGACIYAIVRCPISEVSLRLQVDAMQAALALKADLSAMQDGLAQKADLAALDKVSGGSTSALQSVEATVQQLQESGAELRAALAQCSKQAEVDALSAEVQTKADSSKLDDALSEAHKGHDSLQGCLQEITAVKAQALAAQETAASQVVEVQQALAAKADRAELDKVSGGSAGALQEIEVRVQALQRDCEAAASAQALADLDSKVAAAAGDVAQKVEAVEAAIKGKEDAASAARARQEAAIVLDALQSDLLKLRASVGEEPLAGRLQDLESGLAGKADSGSLAALAADVEAAQSKLRNVSGSEQMAEVQQRLDALSAEMRTAASASGDVDTQLAELTAATGEVPALAQAVASLRAEVPSSAELAGVKEQLTALQASARALEGLPQLEATVRGLAEGAAKVDALAADAALTKEDVLVSRTELERAHALLAEGADAAARLAARLDALDGIAGEVDSVSTQVRSAWNGTQDPTFCPERSLYHGNGSNSTDWDTLQRACLGAGAQAERRRGGAARRRARPRRRRRSRRKR